MDADPPGDRTRWPAVVPRLRRGAPGQDARRRPGDALSMESRPGRRVGARVGLRCAVCATRGYV